MAVTKPLRQTIEGRPGVGIASRAIDPSAGLVEEIGKMIGVVELRPFEVGVSGRKRLPDLRKILEPRAFVECLGGGRRGCTYDDDDAADEHHAETEHGLGHSQFATMGRQAKAKVPSTSRLAAFRSITTV
ncbi:hypothetical protein KZX46_11080 [Polymorphobacter sp. PAMC 29334]|uniref:hypothetical protein n=1 Tax=Polymorphobacter sp. PAMC 29334 TaxID=2862331 RepID=UPI001C790CDB|nr:hypothetical protein [Polymorphobacter sp. PAMC 29334]QYE36409.1 hypothetical protein KZX46_11080 [Polymorphobacter sp. PAMC 29334]